MNKAWLKNIKQDWPYILAICVSVILLVKISNFSGYLLGSPERVFVYKESNGNYKRANVSANPRYTDAKVSRFLRRMVSSCYAIDFDTASAIDNGVSENAYGDCINRHFAPVAANSLYYVFPSDTLLDAIMRSQGRADAVVPYSPVLISRNGLGSDLFWEFEVPMVVTVQSVSTDQTSSFIAIYRVVPDARADNPSSLLIEKVTFI
ncbi:DotI/IcmL/TraM family protein [Vibrio sp. RW]|uniref:DotI/IcmL/TraM family protein n=1 Tax=Vibrio sp. RW TaxID=2998833 RepID=UPI0022CD6294|nr:DotI/IcmL/TraM family protein [Vibrio sp. RW]MDA0146280.1 DotI/IcmL/TraM family protein [Vibrio sp. RW]